MPCTHNPFAYSEEHRQLYTFKNNFKLEDIRLSEVSFYYVYVTAYSFDNITQI